MKTMHILIGLVLCQFALAQNPFVKYSEKYNHKKFEAAKVEFAAYMSDDENQLIYFLNLIRIDPRLFGEAVLPKLAPDLWFVNTNSGYYKSLLRDLKSQKPLEPVIPDKDLYEMAYCHAKTMGQQGKVGHKRISKDCKEGYSGECCSYGISDPLKILIQLLVDEGVPSLGHRKILLDGYKRVGVSIQPHKSHNVNAVLDFDK